MRRFYSDSYWVESYSVACQGWLKTSFLRLVGNDVKVLLITPFSPPKILTCMRVYTVVGILCEQ